MVSTAKVHRIGLTRMVPLEKGKHFHQHQNLPLLITNPASSPIWVRNMNSAQTEYKQAQGLPNVMPGTELELTGCAPYSVFYFQLRLLLEQLPHSFRVLFEIA